MKNTTIAILLSAAFAAPVFAAEQGFFATVDTGQISFTGDNSSYFPKPNAITLGGGYHFNQYVGVEAGYSIVGDSTVETIDIGSSSKETMKTRIFQVTAVGTYPINDKFELFGKLGLANDKFEYTYSYSSLGTSNSTTTSASKTNLMYGVGGQFNINQRFGIRVQYQDFGKATFPNCTGNCDFGATVVSAGAVFNF
ncbi:MAG: porin family protein [Sideroxyarcus sp.]